MQKRLEIPEHFIFNIALTKIIICFTIFTDGTTVWHTHSHPTTSWRANIYVYRGSGRDDSLRGLLSHFFPTGHRQMLWGWNYYTVYIYHHHLPILDLYTTKWGYWFVSGRGSVFISHCFLISSVFSHMPSFHNFLPAARDKLRSVVSVFFFFHPFTDPRFGVLDDKKHVSIC